MSQSDGFARSHSFSSPKEATPGDKVQEESATAKEAETPRNGYRKDLDAVRRESSRESDFLASRQQGSRSLDASQSLRHRDAAVLELVAHWLHSVSNTRRLEILQYCLEPRTFSEVMRYLDLNPNSLDSHAQKLTSAGMLKKTGTRLSSRYMTTERGRLILSLLRELLRRSNKLGRQ